MSKIKVGDKVYLTAYVFEDKGISQCTVSEVREYSGLGECYRLREHPGLTFATWDIHKESSDKTRADEAAF